VAEATGGAAAVSEKNWSVPSATTKYAMQCARLGFQCQELLTTRHLNLPIQGDAADWLRAVRKGEVPFEDWWNRVLQLDAELEAMLDDDDVPEQPDRRTIEDWSVATHLRHWIR
jgi:hypothetical protein